MGLFLLVFFERLSQLPLNDKWRNQNLYKCVHKLCRVQCNFDRVSSAEINFCVVRVPMRAAVADILDCHKDAFEFRRKAQGFDFCFQPGGLIKAFGVVQFSNGIAQPFKAYAKQSAGRTRRKVGDTLSFDKQLFHRFRHVLARLNTKWYGIDHFFVFPDGYLPTRRAVAEVENLNEVISRNFK